MLQAHPVRLRNRIPTAFPPVDLGLQNLRSDVSRAKVKVKVKIKVKVKVKVKVEVKVKVKFNRP